MRHSYVESRFEYRGYPCVIILQDSGHRCGYVGLTRKSPYFQVNYDDIDISCHGGLTYSSEYLYEQEDKNVWWIGFDCAHYDDGKDYEAIRAHFSDEYKLLRSVGIIKEGERRSHNGVVRTMAFVRAELRNIVDQLEDEQ